MNKIFHHALRRAARLCGAAAAMALACTCTCTITSAQTQTQTQTAEPAPAPAASSPPAPRTLELLLSQGHLSAGQPNARAANLRGTWVFADGQVARLEALDETKFDARGGIVAGSYTRSFGADWYATGTLALGHGGPNWAQQRFDLDVATKWGAARSIVTHFAVNGARYDNHRSDHGLRASVVAYLPASTVVEGGILLNVSSPGAVHSNMPYASVTWGREGEQYISLRVASGSEAYQALGAARQLVDFHSSSLGLTWRRWLAPGWGFIATAEAYRNPTYQRRTVGVGLLAQF